MEDGWVRPVAVEAVKRGKPLELVGPLDVSKPVPPVNLFAALEEVGLLWRTVEGEESSVVRPPKLVLPLVASDGASRLDVRLGFVPELLRGRREDGLPSRFDLGCVVLARVEPNRLELVSELDVLILPVVAVPLVEVDLPVLLVDCLVSKEVEVVSLPRELEGARRGLVSRRPELGCFIVAAMTAS